MKKKRTFLISMILFILTFIAGCGEDFLGITFGIEIEPDYKNHPRLGLYYRPESISMQQWANLTQSERAKIALKKCNTKDYKKQHDEWFYYISKKNFGGRKEIKNLPARMHCDKPGSTEINGPIFATIEDYITFIEDVTENIGHAGTQGHVVFPKRPYEGILGYILYESDRSLFRRAKEEYKRYLNNGVIPGSNFRATALGVITKNNWNYFKMNAQRLEQGKKLIFKETGFGKCSCPHLRETYNIVNTIGFELRMEDNPGTAPTVYKKGQKRLIEATKRLTYLLEKEEPFSIFLPLEDSKIPGTSGWNSFMMAFNERIKQIMGRTSQAHLKKVGEDLLTRFENLKSPNFNWHAIYFSKNYTYPLRDWENNQVFLKSMASKKDKNNIGLKKEKIFLTTFSYIDEILKILESDYGINSKNTAKEFRNEKVIKLNNNMQIAAAKWVSDMDFFKHFIRFEKQHDVPLFNVDKIEYKY